MQGEFITSTHVIISNRIETASYYLIIRKDRTRSPNCDFKILREIKSQIFRANGRRNVPSTARDTPVHKRSSFTSTFLLSRVAFMGRYRVRYRFKIASIPCSLRWELASRSPGQFSRDKERRSARGWTRSRVTGIPDRGWSIRVVTAWPQPRQIEGKRRATRKRAFQKSDESTARTDIAVCSPQWPWTRCPIARTLVSGCVRVNGCFRLGSNNPPCT